MNITSGKWLYGPFVSVVALALLSGCVAKKGGQKDTVSDTLAMASADAEELDTSAMSDEERFVHNYRKAGTARMKEQWAEKAGFLVADTAKTAIGTAYVRGGTSRDGFDCSGFVQWAYKHVGVTLPRTAREQSQVGELITDPEELRVGDIVAFRHPRRGYHTGIYTGNGQFVHSPRKRESVKIASLSDPYFRTTFMGARRVNIPKGADIAAAEKTMRAHLEADEQKALQVASLRTSALDGRSKTSDKARLSSQKQSKKSKNSAEVKSRSSRNNRAEKASSRTSSRVSSRTVEKAKADVVAKNKASTSKKDSQKMQRNRSTKNQQASVSSQKKAASSPAVKASKNGKNSSKKKS